MTSAKKTTKKSKKASKKPTKTSKLKNIKKEIKGDKAFVLSDGRQVTNLLQLAMELDNMDDAIFYHHVNDSRNDFSAWIKEVIEEMELAEQLMTVQDKKDYHIILLKHIVKLV